MSTPEQLLEILEETAKLIQKTQINLKKCPKQRLTPGYIETRSKCLEEYWNKFTATHQELIKITKRENRNKMSYFVNEDYYTCEDLYLSMQADLKDLCLQHSPGTASCSSGNSETAGVFTSKLRLPNIELPKFTGRYEEWASFHDLFISLIHKNTSISDVQKLHYLKSSISGEAEALLRHIQITESNYSQAWTALKQRYGNKRLIVNAVIKRLFNQRKITSQSASQIKSLLDTTHECLNNLENLSISTESWDPMIIFLVVQKLDQETHKDWEEYSYQEDLENLPTWDSLKKFLESKFRTLELVSPAATSREKTKEKSFTATATTSTEKTCIKCEEQHTLCHCKQFTDMNVKDRNEYVKKNRLCYNCLLSGHAVSRCRVPINCRICNKRHHSLLHEKREDVSKTENETANTGTSNVSVNHSIEDNTTMTMTAQHSDTKLIALLATALVKCMNEEGHTIILRALIDQGSQACFISEKAAQLLKLKRQSARGSVIGVGSTKTDVKQVVQLQVISRVEDNFCLNIQAYVMNKQLTTKLPRFAVNTDAQHLQCLKLADPTYHVPGSVDLLLGVREYADILQSELIKGPPGTPCAQRTSLGWILFGEIQNQDENNSFLVMHHQVEMDDMLKTLWEIDTETKRKYTQEEQLCEDIYTKTHTRNEDGRYVVTLPFKTQNPKSPDGNTREIAMRRLWQLERKFTKQPVLKEEYVKVIEEYAMLNHMEEVPAEDIYTKKAVYLPHHAVVRCDKESTKTRVVYDASCKGSNNLSLNDELLVGPIVQDDLRSIMMRWRMHAVCFVADIEKMYRMIRLSSTHTDFQRILWRKDSSEPVKDYRLLTVTFGTAPAPYLACRTLNQLANDEGQNYPIAAQMISDFYVDDILSGTDTVETAIEARNQLTEMMKRGGFVLKKWSSNDADFMKSIPLEDRSQNVLLDMNIAGKVKTLGILWNLKTNKFEYKFTLKPSESGITKRSIFSDVQKLYDPLGWLSPSIITAKLLMQKLWLEQVSWDDKINQDLADEWARIRADFKLINDISVERWIHTTAKNKECIQLHGFSDASSRAYAAVVYARVPDPNGEIHISLMAARTRVAPLKIVSIPRLELCGALLLSQLLSHVSRAMKIPKSKVFAWTDSSIVLAWLSGDPSRWKTFVANRVVEIVDNISCSQWYHVLSNENPADIASRGLSVAELKDCDLWWKGPNWLSMKEIKFSRLDNTQTDEEKRTVKEIQTNLKINETENDNTKLINKFREFSNLKELLTTICYCRRFLHYKHNTLIPENEKHVTTKELDESLHRCIKMAQETDFEEEIKALRNGNQVKKRSSLKSLNPYIDSNGVVRVGGRLRNAEIALESKHPIILGNKNELTQLIVKNAHTETLHGGVQLMLTYIRSRYWILRAKDVLKACIKKCLVCAKHNATPKKQLMGDLPKERVSPSRPFLHSGVDFAGPFQVLMSRGRGVKTNKAYIAIFICMAVKAVHLELVGDLTAEAFIGAFRRFTSRRGKCAHLWSDQGRNFVGSSKELVAALQAAQCELPRDVADTLAKDGTQWHFIPAYSPNFGGLWEAGVKSIKHHLKRVLTTNLTFEELTTLLCQIEACLNSRPLTPADDSDIDAIEILTPGHFLIGESPIIVPHPNLENVKTTYLSRWQHMQKLLGDFWKKWQTEYLARLQQRPKWMKQETEFEKGQIVLIKTDNLPPGKWQLGRIIEKHPGPDGLTRVYSVKSGDNVIKRCITKLCHLPVDCNDDS